MRHRTRSVLFVDRLSPKPVKAPTLLDTDLRITPRGRLRLRLIVAPNKRAFDQVTKIVVKNTFPRAWGLVNPLYYDVVSFRRGGRTERREYDKRYFAVMILNASKVRRSTEVVAHECGHAAIFYADRAKGHKWKGRVDVDDEPSEAICYPLGRIFRAVNIALHDAHVWA